jgi:homopolymeric O-antigen transport system ATP-binding protein
MALYKQSFENQAAAEALEAALRPGNGDLRFQTVDVAQPTFDPEEEKVIDFSITPNPDQQLPLHIGCHVLDENRVIVAQCDSRMVDVFVDASTPFEGSLRIRSPWLKPGRYTVDMFISSYAEVTDQWENACVFEVTSALPYRGATPERAMIHSPVLADFSYDLR